MSPANPFWGQHLCELKEGQSLHLVQGQVHVWVLEARLHTTDIRGIYCLASLFGGIEPSVPPFQYLNMPLIYGLGTKSTKLRRLRLGPTSFTTYRDTIVSTRLKLRHGTLGEPRQHCTNDQNSAYQETTAFEEAKRNQSQNKMSHCNRYLDGRP